MALRSRQFYVPGEHSQIGLVRLLQLLAKTVHMERMVTKKVHSHRMNANRVLLASSVTKLLLTLT
jgi:hypothetical protein